MRKQKGFSLIELLIVVAIILIIAAIAIPNLLKARVSANDAAAVGTVRTFVTAEATYQIDNQVYTDQAGLGTAKLIDPTLAVSGATKGGYKYVVTNPTSTADFLVTANPQSTATGTRNVCAATDGALHQEKPGSTTAPTTVAACQAWDGVQ